MADYSVVILKQKENGSVLGVEFHKENPPFQVEIVDQFYQHDETCLSHISRLSFCDRDKDLAETIFNTIKDHLYGHWPRT